MTQFKHSFTDVIELVDIVYSHCLFVWIYPRGIWAHSIAEQSSFNKHSDLHLSILAFPVDVYETASERKQHIQGTTKNNRNLVVRRSRAQRYNVTVCICISFLSTPIEIHDDCNNADCSELNLLITSNQCQGVSDTRETLNQIIVHPNVMHP